MPLPDLIIIVTSVCVLIGTGVSVPSPKSDVSSASDSGWRTASVIVEIAGVPTVLIGNQPSREYTWIGIGHGRFVRRPKGLDY